MARFVPGQGMARRVTLPFAPGDRRPWVLMARQVARDIESGELAPGDRVYMPRISRKIRLETGRSTSFPNEYKGFAYLVDSGILEVSHARKNHGRIYTVAAQPGNGDDMSNWRDEPWARRISGLSRPDRMALISAACLILDYEWDLPDALESELTVFRDCACGLDLEPRMYDLRTVISHYIGEFQGRVEEIRGEMESFRDTLPDTTAEYRAVSARDASEGTGGPSPDVLESIDAKLDKLLSAERGQPPQTQEDRRPAPPEQPQEPSPGGSLGTSRDGM